MNPVSFTFPLRHRSRTGGFTLVELLAVIAIIAVLAAILLPALSGMRRSASAAHSSAQMRKIGLALQGFVQDNRGLLPTSPTYGALHAGQGPWFNRDDRRLQNLIGAYLGSPEGTTWTTNGSDMDYDASFAWPGWEADSQPGAPSVLLNTQVKFAGGTALSSPWAGSRPAGSTRYRGKSAADIENPVKERVFIEVDQQNTTAGWRNLLPEKPVHGSHRNALYFDWHVGRVPVDS